jgi:S-adenosylmethionine-diacylglycerol 3-amino-3-carboxypropyl transferase
VSGFSPPDSNEGPRPRPAKSKRRAVAARRHPRTGVDRIRPAPLADWFSGKAFSFVHSRNLVYNTCWEDPRLDREALALGPDDVVVVITSAGCNTLDYALDAPRRIHAVDMNPRQNALLELKIAGIRHLDFGDFFRLFGEGHHPDFARLLDGGLARRLSPWARAYWQKHAAFFTKPDRSFYFCGSSGSVARFCNYYIDKVAKMRGDIRLLLDARSLDEQRAIYDRSIRRAFWSGFMKKFVGSDTTLSMLGVPRQQRQQVELHFGGGITEFIEECVETVFTRLPIHDNYFWRIYLDGRYSRECCPNYLREENFNRLKGGLVDAISIHTNTVEGFLRMSNERVTRYILLDHMDWLSTYRYESLVDEWQAIVDRAAPRCRVLFRSGGMKVEYVDPIPVTVGGQQRRVGDLMTYHPEWAARLHAVDRVHTYGSFYIADLNTGA